MQNPYAVFDALALGERVGGVLGGILRSELHSLCYIACLSSVYRGDRPEDWGYYFVGAQPGCPHSHCLQSAADHATRRGWLEHDRQQLSLTASGRSLYEQLSALPENEARVQCLNAAFSVTLTFPVGVIRAAMSIEPALSPARRLNTSRMLSEGPRLDSLLEQFHAVRQTLGAEGTELSVPLTVWIAALCHTSLTSEDDVTAE